MKLSEFLDEHKNDTVFIGAASAFVYIGRGEKFNSDRADLIYISKLRAKLNHGKGILQNIQKWTAPATWRETIPVFEADIHDEKAIDNYCLALKRAVENYKNIQARLIEMANNTSKANKEVQECKKRLKNFVSFKNREVKESYDRIQNDGIVVIIEGFENGDLWSKTETKNGYSLKLGSEEAEDGQVD